ncbi:hypothetical protein ASPVEDRAFT_85365 [Aspergillus versicolor CBS 583.65]|uniref:Uncharacterized protein n=1 Tax=Aspergillus versicolor CBS 583.65 TaxID=1036611 RepID=A0A1L9PQY4_ASPVE|nr:uncharacterized protein ASPVEDRAFT_85365 [Aspergillus versicolor CBS 583.65]OJJ03944.1 hypothetical protein ASPVEDRAFT_85365 [Aspergillus versicolor CBS 583.65]
MTQRDIPFHIIAGSVDLESRKTPTEKAAEEVQVVRYPKYERQIRFRATQKMSIKHFSDIARYLDQCGMTLYVINCGYHTDKREWQVLIIFGKEGFTDEACQPIRNEVLSRFVDGSPEIDLPVKGPGDFPKRLILPWIGADKFTNMTKLASWEGQPYLYFKDGEKDAHEFREFGQRVCEVIQFGSVVKYFFKLFPPERTFRQDLTLERALEKIKLPSLNERTETQNIKWDETMAEAQKMLDQLDRNREERKARSSLFYQ